MQVASSPVESRKHAEHDGYERDGIEAIPLHLPGALQRYCDTVFQRQVVIRKKGASMIADRNH